MIQYVELTGTNKIGSKCAFLLSFYLEIPQLKDFFLEKKPIVMWVERGEATRGAQMYTAFRTNIKMGLKRLLHVVAGFPNNIS